MQSHMSISCLFTLGSLKPFLIRRLYKIRPQAKSGPRAQRGLLPALQLPEWVAAVSSHTDASHAWHREHGAQRSAFRHSSNQISTVQSWCWQPGEQLAWGWGLWLGGDWGTAGTLLALLDLALIYGGALYTVKLPLEWPSLNNSRDSLSFSRYSTFQGKSSNFQRIISKQNLDHQNLYVKGNLEVIHFCIIKIYKVGSQFPCIFLRNLLQWITKFILCSFP